MSLPEVSSGKAILMLAVGAFLGGIIAAALTKYGVVSAIQKPLTSVSGSLKAA
jgi:hypothetical protein